MSATAYVLMFLIPIKFDVHLPFASKNSYELLSLRQIDNTMT